MMSRRIIAAGYVGVFVLGTVAGGTFMQARIDDQRSALEAPSSPRYATYLWSLDRKLKLSPSQRQTIEGILAHQEPRRRAAMQPVEPRLLELRTEVRHEISEVLDTKQRAEFEEISRQHDEERQRRSPPPAASESSIR